MAAGEVRDGQSTVEFALLLPLVVVCVALILMVVSVTQGQLTIISASRNAVRAAIMYDNSTTTATEAATDAALDTTAVRPLRVTLTTRDDFVTATVSAQWHLPFPILRTWLPHITLTSSTTMLSEATNSSL